jgi:glycosyltransferase involved in cell wall biosynthesis
MSVLRHKYVVGHNGRRDYYQVAVALAEVGGLEKLVTALYCPDELARYAHALPMSVRRMALRRRAPGLSSRLVSMHDVAVLLALEAARRLYNRSPRLNIDARLGAGVARIARTRGCGAVVYGYHWEGFLDIASRTRSTGPQLLYVSEPLPSQLREVLRADRLATGISYGAIGVEGLTDAEVWRREEAFLKADGAIVPSSYVRDGLAARGMPADRIKIVPYGGDMSVRLDDVPALPTARNDSSRDLRLLFIGQPIYLKGAHHLATALKMLGRTDVTLTAVAYHRGANDPFGELPTPVRWLPRAGPSDLRHLFATHDVLVFPSLAEAFGLVCVEALHAGLPVIATRRTGGPDVISPGEDGLLVDGGNPTAIADAIRQLADSPEMVARLKRGAREAGGRWTWERFRAGVISAIRDFERV